MDKHTSSPKRPTLLTIPVLRDVKAADIVEIKNASRRDTSDARAVAAGFGFVLSFIMFALIVGVVIPFQA